MEKKPWDKPGSVGGQFSSGQRRNSVWFGQHYKSDWIRTLRVFVHFHLKMKWASDCTISAFAGLYQANVKEKFQTASVTFLRIGFDKVCEIFW